jgi:mono/diheme cytochrome c family protein
MRRLCLVVIIAVVVSAWLVSRPRAAENAAAARGKQALLGRAFSPPFWSRGAYENAWHQWGGAAKERPADYAAAFRDRYGLHPAPYPNGGLPMGLRQTSFLLKSGIGNDCLLCHGGAVLGQSYVGLGNATADLQALFEELSATDGQGRHTPHVFCNVRGTNEAGAMAVYLIAFRDADLKFRRPPLDLDLHADLCEDVPAWWLLKKKKTMYHTGGTSARSVRSLMQFMMHPLNTPETFKREESSFEDIQAYLLSLEPPKYPFPIDRELARKGESVFRQNCARCHGTYGADWTYPNKIVPLDEIGTDPTRHRGITEKFGRHYNATWFAKGKNGGYPTVATAGYQAPPLDGVWATAPYFHNGSAPTVYDVLNSKARPRIFTRSYRTDKEVYDPIKLGWKVQVLDRALDPRLPAIERRKVYDTTRPGRGNGGHPFGDKLSDEERRAVIEYVKTL